MVLLTMEYDKRGNKFSLMLFFLFICLFCFILSGSPFPFVLPLLSKHVKCFPVGSVVRGIDFESLAISQYTGFEQQKLMQGDALSY